MVSLTNVAFSVPGEPQGKGRARVGKVGGFVRMFTPEKTVAYESLIALAARESMAGADPFPGAVTVSIVCNHSVPRSWSRIKREAALAGAKLPVCKPDLDNVAKAVGDGCNGVVWQDDRQIAALVITRRYALTPGLWVTVAHRNLEK
jgi:Holliday junction resolvase RusA-like endonuclease